MSDIFISYKREEQATARQLANALEGEGWTVWWDPKLRAGERFNDVIEKALKESKCVVVMWSKRSVESQYVKHEANYALKRNKLVPVMIEKVELPFRFEDLHTPSLLGWDGSKDFSEFRKLAEDIAAILDSRMSEDERGQPAEIQRPTPETAPEEAESKHKPGTTRKNAERMGRESTTRGYSSPLQFETFTRTALANENIRIVGITVTNASENRLQHCSLRIERIKPSGPDSIYWILSESKLRRPLPTENEFSLNPRDHRDVPIAQLDSINSRLDNLGIELLCYSTQEYPALDLEQSYLVTIRGSAETGTPIERDYRLWVDGLKQLCFRDANSC